MCCIVIQAATGWSRVSSAARHPRNVGASLSVPVSDEETSAGDRLGVPPWAWGLSPSEEGTASPL